MFGLLDKLKALVHLVKVFGKLAVVVGPALAAFVYSPIFRQVFLGIAVGAAVMFGVLYADLFPPPQSSYCISPKADPNGPKCMKWVSTDDRRGYGYWRVCEDLQ
jgi:hypothetical protein